MLFIMFQKKILLVLYFSLSFPSPLPPSFFFFFSFGTKNGIGDYWKIKKVSSLTNAILLWFGGHVGPGNTNLHFQSILPAAWALMLQKDLGNIIPSTISLSGSKHVLYVTGNWRTQGKCRTIKEGKMVGQEEWGEEEREKWWEIKYVNLTLY